MLKIKDISKLCMMLEVILLVLKGLLTILDQEIIITIKIIGNNEKYRF